MQLQEYLHGEYAIAIVQHKYDTVCQPEFYSSEDYKYFDEYETFSLKEALEKKEELDNGFYILGHNEYSRPDYIIVPENTARYIFCGRNGDPSNYDWDDAECDCGECRICTEMINSQDIEYLKTKGEKILKEYKLLKDRLKNEKGEQIKIDELDNYTGKIIEKDIGTYYMKEGKLHREDGPAIELVNGTKYWFKEGKLRGIEGLYGQKVWYKEGELYGRDAMNGWRWPEKLREIGPAVEATNGTKVWYKEGLQIRDEGPAIEESDGKKEWWKEGKLHREDGPAVEQADGRKEYWIKGNKYTMEKYNEEIKKQELEKNKKKVIKSSMEL